MQDEAVKKIDEVSLANIAGEFQRTGGSLHAYMLRFDGEGEGAGGGEGGEGGDEGGDEGAAEKIFNSDGSDDGDGESSDDGEGEGAAEGEGASAETPGEDDDSPDDGGEDGDDGDPAASEVDQYEDFSVPEGMELDAAMVEKFTPLARETKLSQEDAQKFVDLYAEGKQKALDENKAIWDGIHKGWKDEIEADPDLGGDKLDATLGSAKTAVDLMETKFGCKGLAEAIEMTGVGNHPAVIKMFHALGVEFGDDGDNPPSGGADMGTQEGFEGAARKIFTTMK